MNQGVAGSNPVVHPIAAVAQLVERHLGKMEVHGFDPHQQLCTWSSSFTILSLKFLSSVTSSFTPSK